MVVVVVGRGGGSQHSKGGRGGGRWKSEQNNLAQWELRCRGAQDGRVEGGGGGVRAGITVLPQAWTIPTILHSSLVPIRIIL